MVLRPGHDWVYPYYRDRALCLALGVTPYEMLLAGGGRGRRSRFRRPPDALALGRAQAQHRDVLFAHRHAVRASGGMRGSQPLRRSRIPDEVTLVTGGDGATSEGEFWEAMNVACLNRLPVLVSDRRQRLRHLRADRVRRPPAATSRTGVGLSPPVPPGSGRHRFPGVLPRSAARPRRIAVPANGPALVHAHVVRLYSHSLSDDERLYKTAAERKAEAERDPVLHFPEVPGGRGHSGPPGARSSSCTKSTKRSTKPRRELCARKPPATYLGPCSSLFRPRRSHLGRVRRRAARLGRAQDHGRPAQRHASRRDAPQSQTSWSSAKTWPIAAAKKISPR